MNYASSLVLCLLLYVASCQTTKPDVAHPEKNGALIMSMERTPCYGRCPIYSIKLYENGLLIYDARKFTDTTGCFYRVLSKQEISAVNERFKNAGFFELDDSYPRGEKTPVDLPSCILFFNNKSAQKTISDKHWHSPETLTGLEKAVDSLIVIEKLQFCDTKK